MKRIIIICIPLLIIGSLSYSKEKDRYLNLQIFAKVLNIVQKYYVEPVDMEKLIYGGIKGMLNELDPHTNFLPPNVYKEFQEETSGEFGGLGIEIAVENGILTIISPIEDTPAWKAGILAGDKIVAIDGTTTKAMNLVEAAQLMKGKNGDAIVLSIIRESLEEPKDFKIVRGKIKIKSVKMYELQDQYVYVRLTSFIENSYKDLKKLLKKYKSKNKEIKGIVLDLRRNPGGLLDQAVSISDLFLDEGVIVSTVGRDTKNKEVLKAKKGNDYTDIPMVVLINEYSASASEIVAGALKDNKRALIMGKRSFGKGSVQSVVKMDDGSALKLTVARYYTPSGISIQAEGITPDVELEEVNPETFAQAIIQRDAKREADIVGHLASEKKQTAKKKKTKSWWNFRSKDKNKAEELKKDYQVMQALNYLKAWKTLKSFN